jgi:Luciferase-like monooxygenase
VHPDAIDTRGAKDYKPTFGVLRFGVKRHESFAHDVAETLRLARHAEGLGFYRFWLTQHYGEEEQWGDLMPILTLLAAATRRIRVGTGGILLRHSLSVQLASGFRFLTSLYPGRVELGIARGVSTNESLRARFDTELLEMSFEGRLLNLRSALDANSAVPPRSGSVPELWLLGTNSESANLAAKHHTNYAHATFFSSSRDAAPLGFRSGRYALAYLIGLNDGAKMSGSASAIAGNAEQVVLRGSVDSIARTLLNSAEKHGASDVLLSLIGGDADEEEAWLNGFASAVGLEPI